MRVRRGGPAVCVVQGNYTMTSVTSAVTEMCATPAATARGGLLVPLPGIVNEEHCVLEE